MISSLEEIKKEFLAVKEKAGNPAYIACFGKAKQGRGCW